MLNKPLLCHSGVCSPLSAAVVVIALAEPIPMEVGFDAIQVIAVDLFAFGPDDNRGLWATDDRAWMAQRITKCMGAPGTNAH